jgi:hypothetical protein
LLLDRVFNHEFHSMFELRQGASKAAAVNFQSYSDFNPRAGAPNLVLFSDLLNFRCFRFVSREI